VEDYINVFNYVVPLASSILLFWLAASMLVGGLGGDALSVGVFLAFNTALGTFVGGVTHLSGTVLEFMDTIAKAKRLEPLLQAEIEVDESAADPGKLRGKVSFTGVEFRYTEDGPKILDGVSFVAQPEEFIAFVGPSGSGKSTIFRLLLGFEEPEAGRVCFDDQDLASIDVTAVRRQLGVVLQTSRINAGSIMECITSGVSVSLDETWEAAEDAGFADDIREMPMGMHTMVSEGGSNLSGGQRQRLLIARALLSRPKVLLFDEATSALDNRTQNIVSRSLERRKVTRIVIAHRLSTIRNANRIYVLDQGELVESGTFDELVNAQQLFASMMARQVA
jgi:ABC-type bacteriocin/lantibiotic exporter with double-glycine peptidase domain